MVLLTELFVSLGPISAARICAAISNTRLRNTAGEDNTGTDIAATQKINFNLLLVSASQREI